MQWQQSVWYFYVLVHSSALNADVPPIIKMFTLSIMRVNKFWKSCLIPRCLTQTHVFSFRNTTVLFKSCKLSRVICHGKLEKLFYKLHYIHVSFPIPKKQIHDCWNWAIKTKTDSSNRRSLVWKGLNFVFSMPKC